MKNRQAFEKQVAQRIGENVAKLRKDRGWDRKEVAGSLGISDDYLGKVERGQRSLSPGDLVRLAYLFGIDIDRLVFGPGERPKLLPLNKIDLAE